MCSNHEVIRDVIMTLCVKSSQSDEYGSRGNDSYGSSTEHSNHDNSEYSNHSNREKNASSSDLLFSPPSPNDPGLTSGSKTIQNNNAQGKYNLALAISIIITLIIVFVIVIIIVVVVFVFKAFICWPAGELRGRLMIFRSFSREQQ